MKTFEDKVCEKVSRFFLRSLLFAALTAALMPVWNSLEMLPEIGIIDSARLICGVVIISLASRVV